MTKDKHRNKRLYLIDGNSYIHRAYHAIRDLRTSRGIPSNAIYGFLVMMVKVLKDEKPDLAAVVFDAGGLTERHRLYPAYKANRPPMPDDMAVQLDYIRKLTAAFGLAVVEKRGVEADDILATLGRRARRQGMDVTYVSGDKDLLQLLDDQASVLDTMKDKRTDLEGFRKERGLTPEQFLDVMALMGDSSDNVPGVPGIGPKTAEKLIREHGSLDEIYRRLDDLPPGKVRETLAANRDQARMCRRLVALRDDVDIALDEADLAPRPDKKALRRILEELEFKRFLKEFDLGDEAAVAGFEVVEHLGGDGPLTLAHAGAADGTGTVEAALTRDGRTVTGITIGGAAAVPAAVKRLLEDPQVPKRGYDMKAALKLWRRAGVTLRGIQDDVLLQAYLLNPSELGNDMASLAAAWLGTGLPEEEKPGSQGKLFADPEALKRRAAAQAVTGHRLADVLAGELERAGATGLYRDVELPLVGILDAMETVGIAVDLDALNGMSKEMDGSLSRLEEDIYRLAGTRFAIASPKQLAEVLFGKLGLPTVKKTKTGYSTDEEVLTVLSARHELPAQVLNYRQLAKLKNTYVDVIPTLVSAADGRLHTTFNQAVTATGRLSSSNPNLQNIPIRSEWGMRIRKAFVAGPGWTFISADYSQIELRLLAHLSGDEALSRAFLRGDDIHARTASAIFGAAPDGITKEMRRAAKVINFGIIYGMSPYGLAKELGLEQKVAKKYIDEYFDHYPGVRAYLEKLVAQAKRDGYVATLFGRRRYLRELQSDKPQVVQFAERAALNTPIQGTAADLIKVAMVALSRRLAAEKLRARLLLQIHDELLMEAPAEEVRRVKKLLQECMEGAASFNVPIVVDVADGLSWGDLP